MYTELVSLKLYTNMILNMNELTVKKVKEAKYQENMFVTLCKML